MDNILVSQTCEIDYRIGECIFYHIASNGIISSDEYEMLRDKLIYIYMPVISKLERGLQWEKRKSLK